MIHRLIVALALMVPGLPAQTPGGPWAAVEVGLEEKQGRTLPLDVVLMDEQGHPAPLRRLVDKPTLLTLNYFRCTLVCTPQLNGLLEVLEKIPAQPGTDFQVLTVSFDPRDTPDMAARKRSNYLAKLQRPFPPEAWRFLTGSGEATAALAEGVGFRYQKQGDGYAHPAALILVSPKGVITRYLYGSATLPADLQMAIEEAARGESRPSINKLLSICFRYDPQGGRYLFSVTRLAAVVILTASVIYILALVVQGRRTRRVGRP